MSNFEQTSLEMSQVGSFGPEMTLCTIRQGENKRFEIGPSCELSVDKPGRVGVFLHDFSVSPAVESVYLSADDAKRLGEALLTIHQELSEHGQEIIDSCRRTRSRVVANNEH